MIRKRYFFIWLVISVLVFNYAAFAQVSVDDMIMEGKRQLAVGVDNWNEDTIIKARSLFERLLMQKEKLDLVHYYIGYADYRLASRYFTSKDPKAEQYLNDGIAHLEKAIKENKKLADAHALVSSLYGQKITLDPSAAMTLGQQLWMSMDNAKKLEPENPRVLFLNAVSTYYSPEQFGGSKAEGVKQLEKAITTFEKQPSNKRLMPDWGYEDALMMMATWKIEQGDVQTALDCANKTLEFNPNFIWAKEVKDSLVQKQDE